MNTLMNAKTNINCQTPARSPTQKQEDDTLQHNMVCIASRLLQDCSLICHVGALYTAIT